MASIPANGPEREDSDKNNEEAHDPVAAGKAAIEAGKIANEKDKPASQQQAEEKKDAEQWRNEG